LYDETHFMFLTDHGGIEYGHGGVSTDEMVVPWGITGPHWQSLGGVILLKLRYGVMGIFIPRAKENVDRY